MGCIFKLIVRHRLFEEHFTVCFAKMKQHEENADFPLACRAEFEAFSISIVGVCAALCASAHSHVLLLQSGLQARFFVSDKSRFRSR
jgi:hypothetical protein